MAYSLGFSAGVMMFVSFTELLATAITTIGFIPSAIAFFTGIIIMFLVDLAVPHEFISEHKVDISKYCPELTAVNNREGGRFRYRHGQGLAPQTLLRTSLLIALGIGLHNLPEGMATFAGAIKDRALGIAIAVAIALHNIPEGLAVAVPVLCATGSKKKALLWASLSGGAELAGAILAALALMPFLTATTLNLLLAGVGGLMVFISFDELIPGSYSYASEHLSVAGILSGMIVMAGSLLLFQ